MSATRCVQYNLFSISAMLPVSLIVPVLCFRVMLDQKLPRNEYIQQEMGGVKKIRDVKADRDVVLLFSFMLRHQEHDNCNHKTGYYIMLKAIDDLCRSIIIA